MSRAIFVTKRRSRINIVVVDARVLDVVVVAVFIGVVTNRRWRRLGSRVLVSVMLVGERVNAKYKSSLLFIDETRVPLTAPAFP